MKKTPKPRRSKVARRSTKVLKWAGTLAAVALVVYGITQMSGVAYTDKDLGVVDFSNLDRSEKKTALEAVNRARCTCGCGMTLAQCVATDSTCPIRTDNIDKIKTIVQQSKPSRRGD